MHINKGEKVTLAFNKNVPFSPDWVSLSKHVHDSWKRALRDGSRAQTFFNIHNSICLLTDFLAYFSTFKGRELVFWILKAVASD